MTRSFKKDRTFTFQVGGKETQGTSLQKPVKFQTYEDCRVAFVHYKTQGLCTRGVHTPIAEFLIQWEQKSGNMNHEKSIQSADGRSPGSWWASEHIGHVSPVHTYLRAGSLPKNKTKVMNDIKSTRQITLFTNPILKGPRAHGLSRWPKNIQLVTQTRAIISTNSIVQVNLFRTVY